MKTGTILSVRDVNKTVFKEFKGEVAKEGIKLGAALTQAMEFWMHLPKKKVKRSIASFKGHPWGKGTEKVSENIDSILYG